jgi:flagellar biosynthesis/type III secretory pathway chaperone
MDASQSVHYQNLNSNLDELVKLYRSLLDIVRREKELLLQVDLESLNESNKVKESLLLKIRATDLIRERYARDLAREVGADTKNPRLLDIAKKMQDKGVPAEAERLQKIHGVLVLLIERVSEINRDNAQYTESALRSLNVALGDVKTTLGGKKTYERKGKMNEGPNKAGNFVSKEA